MAYAKAVPADATEAPLIVLEMSMREAKEVLAMLGDASTLGYDVFEALADMFYEQLGWTAEEVVEYGVEKATAELYPTDALA